MADSTAKDWIERGDNLFSKRSALMSLWQEQADNFYPERADFTTTRSIGTTFAENLMTSYPLLARRELGDGLGSMLRPKEKEWFFTETTRQDRVDNAGKKWLEAASTTMRRAMYARATKFVRATKEGDHDFACFGQTVLSAELNRDRDDMLYRCWHLRDVVWCEDQSGDICEVHRKWKLYARDAVKLFRKSSSSLQSTAEKSPYEEVELRHIVCLAENYEGEKKWRTKWVSIYIDVANGTMLEEVGSRGRVYVIPRWQTVSGSQYAYSPASVAALPDARLIQAMTLTLLEAGEKYTNPPLIAVQDAIRSDIQLFSGGITMVDADYDERLGEVLRPITSDKAGMPIGRDLRNDVRDLISHCFYLDKLTGPSMGDRPQMTAFEVGQRVQAYIRAALPLFEPMEQDYNGGMCDETFDILLHAGAFGGLRDMPASLRGQDIRFRFESPLTEIIDAQKGQKLGNAKQLLAQVADVAPESAHVVDWAAAYRDALEGMRTPMAWINSPEMSRALGDAQKQAAQQQALLQGMQQAADVADTLGSAGAGLAKGAQALPAAVAPMGA
jgi:hypothetical protein